MGLDMRHKNIGATVSMLRLLSSMGAGDEMDVALAELFMAESDECDYYMLNNDNKSKTCHFGSNTHPCCIGECPLGPLVDDELKTLKFSDIHQKIKEV